MGSLSASGIPVVTKQPVSFRKHDIRIKSTDNRTDAITVVTTDRPSTHRAIGSGSIVRSGVVEYYQELSLGAIRMGRTSEDRIASATAAASRTRVVDLDGNTTRVVIESGLNSPVPSLHAAHRGERIAISNSLNDTFSRVSSSGAFDRA